MLDRIEPTPNVTDPSAGALPNQGQPTYPADESSGLASNAMQVTKRDGSLEPVDLNKILRAVTRCCVTLSQVDPMRVATRTISGLHDGVTTKKLDELSIRTAAGLMYEEPQYSRLGANLLAAYIDKEVENQDIHSFSQAIAAGHNHGLIGDRLFDFVRQNRRKLNSAIDASRDQGFEYFGLRTVYDRYLLKHPATRSVIETPQYLFMRVACALSPNVREALALYGLFSRLEYLPSSPTLFNAGTRHEQLSSCFLLDSPADDLQKIYDRYSDIAMLSKFSGGIGLAYHRVRSSGSLIRSTNGLSNGIVPWLKTLDASVAAVNQGGRRKGACCVYLETWHGDIEEFLDLRDNTGDDARRTHNLNISNWVPDLFMRRVEADQEWTLFDPKVVPNLSDLYGEEFEEAYLSAEAEGLGAKRVSARELYRHMMLTLAQTGNGWMTFKDSCNLKCNQTGLPENVVHLSNLCTEIVEVTASDESAVCNLGSVNLSRYLDGNSFNFEKLAENVRIAVRQLDAVIDLNYYPIKSTKLSNSRWRPVGLGLMGLQDVFFKLGLPFDAPQSKILSARISEEIYYAALSASCELAEEHGKHPAFDETRAAQGALQFDAWGVQPTDPQRWNALRERIKTSGLRNSLMIAIAPTATIASIAGCYECIEPQVSNLFKRETLSGDFLQVNRYLVEELQQRGLWTEEMRSAIKVADGSIQSVPGIPDELKAVYRTAWEVPMRSLIDMAADRGAFIDQSQSLNLFMESPDVARLSSMYFHAWKKGLKTTYYLRSRPATSIAKTTVGAMPPTAQAQGHLSTQEHTCLLEHQGGEGCPACEMPEGVRPSPPAATPPLVAIGSKEHLSTEALACSLENPESCESCQ